MLNLKLYHIKSVYSWLYLKHSFDIDPNDPYENQFKSYVQLNIHPKVTVTIIIVTKIYRL